MRRMPSIRSTRCGSWGPVGSLSLDTCLIPGEPSSIPSIPGIVCRIVWSLVPFGCEVVGGVAASWSGAARVVAGWGGAGRVVAGWGGTMWWRGAVWSWGGMGQSGGCWMAGRSSCINMSAAADADIPSHRAFSLSPLLSRVPSKTATCARAHAACGEGTKSNVWS